MVANVLAVLERTTVTIAAPDSGRHRQLLAIGMNAHVMAIGERGVDIKRLLITEPHELQFSCPRVTTGGGHQEPVRMLLHVANVHIRRAAKLDRFREFPGRDIKDQQQRSTLDVSTVLGPRAADKQLFPIVGKQQGMNSTHVLEPQDRE